MKLLKMIAKNRALFLPFFIFFIVLMIAGAAFILRGRSSASQPITNTSYALDTIVSVTVYSGKDEPAAKRALKLCASYEDVFSRTKEGSLLNTLNSSRMLSGSDELAGLIKDALYFCSLSGGAFDITMGDVSSLYDFTGERNTPPDEDELAFAAGSVGYEKINVTGNEISLDGTGFSLDLGAIAKGYIADRLKEYLIDEGVENAIIDLGGNILCLGNKPDGTEFKIGIKYPLKNSSETLCALGITDKAVVTSGVYERCFEYDGELYHHILDAKTGRPSRSGLVSVTIIASDSETADALSTLCFVLGAEEGKKLIDSFPGAGAAFVDENLKITYAGGFDEFILDK